MHDIYMISITGNPVSEHYKKIVTPSWESRGYELQHFEAVTPKDLHRFDNLNFGQRAPKRNAPARDFTPTEKAIWCSHFALWKVCIEINRPICIVEHDCYLIDHLPDFGRHKMMLFCIFQLNHGSPYIKHGIWNAIAPCGGYFITPEAAKRLTNKSQNSIIELNVDWTVHDTWDDYHLEETNRNIVEFQKYLWDWVVAFQYQDDMGTTIEHS